MTHDGYVSERRLLREEMVCSKVLEDTIRRTQMLALSIDNNPYYFHATYPGAAVINQLYREAINTDENPEAFQTFML